MLDSADTPLTQEILDDGYLLDVAEVASLLGVTRTRVSQLTSNGQLSFERRRVGMRNKLFYKRSEVLAYKQTFYGRHVAGGSAPVLSEFALTPDSHENLQWVGITSNDRSGGATAGAPRTLRHMPEQLLVETQKMLQQEIHVEQRLIKLDEHVQGLSTLMKGLLFKEKSSALAVAKNDERSEKIEHLMEKLTHLGEQLNQHKCQFESLSVTVSGLQKQLNRLSLQQEQLFLLHKNEKSALNGPSLRLPDEQCMLNCETLELPRRPLKRNRTGGPVFRKKIARR